MVAPRFFPYKFFLQSLFMRQEYKGSKYGIRYLLLYSKTSCHGGLTHIPEMRLRDMESQNEVVRLGVYGNIPVEMGLHTGFLVLDDLKPRLRLLTSHRT